MKTLKILIDHKDIWSPYYPSDNVITISNYLQQTSKNENYIINLSEKMEYLEEGYYASLLGEANKDSVLPDITTLNSLKYFDHVALLSSGIRLNQQQLNKMYKDENIINIKVFFGVPSINGFEKLAKKVFEYYSAPILVLTITKSADIWQISNITLGKISTLSDEEQTVFAESLNAFSSKVWRKKKVKKSFLYDLAILHDPSEKIPPSNKKAISKFVKAANDLGIHVDLITKDDYMKVPEYDALFIRTTTAINHYSYAFAKKAEDNNLVVIDDTKSITRCTNKVYLHNLMTKHKILAPESKLIFKDIKKAELEEIVNELGFPIVLKIPDGSFSKGVKKAKSFKELEVILKEMLADSAIIIAQKYYFTEFDWRIGILNGKPLYACKYYMAKNHWQIVNYKKNTVTAGGADAYATHQVDKSIMKAALKATKLVGTGLYGVDIKVVNGKPMIIEINDNPSLDAGYEDAYIGDALYSTIMLEFLNRMNFKKLPYAS
ncbi:RimK family protein [Pseudofrancisella aestuarii]|uniref:RimK family protein n=1 Tax=Pseudofrancisella aestuarii TaxID=2670347 RepID=A0ABV9TAW5_9GAMM|nr:RimK family protein [Pseudofrancisella aestuarii]